MTTAGSSPANRLPVGTRLDGRFEIQEYLGGGSFGDVYLARQLVFGHPIRRVALKLFRAGCVNRANVAAVLGDAIALASLLDDDPPLEVARRIVQVLDVGIVQEPEQRAYMSMQLVRGGDSLQRQVRGHRDSGMPVELSLYYLHRILIPLSWMHEHAMVHGDLKPDNILISPDGDIVLTDFGLAANLPVGVLGGAICYQAPEVLRGQTGETAADIFSLGVLWYATLTGRTPFDAVGLVELAEGDVRGCARAQLAARKWPIRPPTDNVPPEEEQRLVPASEVSAELAEHPQLESLLNRCLAPRESDRIPNAELLKRELERYLRSGTMSNWILEATEGTPELETAPSSRADVQDALAVLARGQTDAAASIIDELLREDSQRVDVIVAESRVKLARHDVAGARDCLGRALALAPKDPAVFEALALVYDASGRREQAHQMRMRAETLRKRP